MATKKLTKEEVRTPDFFLTHGHHFAEFLVKHKTPILTVLLTAFGAGLIWLGVSYWQTHQENMASAAFYPVEKKIQDELEKTKTVTDASVIDYEKALRAHASTRGALVSVITVTPELLQAGRAATVAGWFKLLTNTPASTEVGFGLLRMTQALVALENHQPDEALALYQEVLGADAQKSFQPEAMVKMGVAYEAKNDFTKARELFEKVHREHPSTQAGELAFQYLLYLDRKKGA